MNLMRSQILVLNNYITPQPCNRIWIVHIGAFVVISVKYMWTHVLTAFIRAWYHYSIHVCVCVWPEWWCEHNRRAKNAFVQKVLIGLEHDKHDHNNNSIVKPTHTQYMDIVISNRLTATLCWSIYTRLFIQAKISFVGSVNAWMLVSLSFQHRAIKRT